MSETLPEILRAVDEGASLHPDIIGDNNYVQPLAPPIDIPAALSATKESSTSTEAIVLEFPVKEPWLMRAQCNDGTGENIKYFFPINSNEFYNEAIKICGKCAVKQECLNYAINNHEPTGVWGGKWFVNGKPKDKKPVGRPSL
jgi:hypothetical protein